jgi:hypothetical protein
MQAAGKFDGSVVRLPAIPSENSSLNHTSIARRTVAVSEIHWCPRVVVQFENSGPCFLSKTQA